MIGIVKVISTSFDKFNRLLVKSLFMGAIQNGKGDVRQPLEAGPFGIDSNPTQDKRALFTTTSTIGKYYIFGYLNTNRKAQVGETRIFSTTSDGQFKFNIWLKADGKALIGDSDNTADYTNFAVKFNELKTEFNKLKSDFNQHIQDYNTHSHPVPGVTVGSGSTTSSTTSVSSSPNTSNIDNAKNDKIQYN